MDNYILMKAIKSDIDKIYELIEKRIKWMDKNNIHQWNKTNYLDSYPKAYFEGKVADGELYVMTDENSKKIVGAVVLLEEDERWQADVSNSYYLHNLVSDIEAPGIGARIIHLCEKVAIEKGKEKIRLDCQTSNRKLNKYYNELGFEYVGSVHEGSYVGNKREKKLNW